MTITRKPAVRSCERATTPSHRLLLAGALACCLPGFAHAVSTEERLDKLEAENRELRELLLAQRAELRELRSMFDDLAARPAPGAAGRHVAEQTDEPPRVRTASPAGGDGERRLIVSGQAGFALFAGGSNSQFPNAEFRVDDAIINIEAELTRNAYVVTEFYLTRREAFSEAFRMGELYVDFENVSRFWGAHDLVNVRAGRFDTPFGEEYLRRDPIANPLVSHSLADIWGTDEGIEVYGRTGRWDYVFAVQNGSQKTLRDFNNDKALIARIGVNPASGWRLSASAMRTGDLDAEEETQSEIWIGNTIFRPIGSSATTAYSAELAQFDLRHDWRTGHLAGAVGGAWYSDDDPDAVNRRRFGFFSLEAQQSLTRKFYGAARYSELRADQGYPLPGMGDSGTYVRSSPHTRHLRRLGLGIGWRVSPMLLLKTEYTFEQGRLIDGTKRTDSDQISAEAAVRF